MKQKWDKLRKKIKINKKMTIFFTIITIIALITGTVYALFLSSEDKVLVVEQINQFITNISDSKIDYIQALIGALSSNLLFALAIWLFGLSVIGVPIMIIMYFLKVFILGFSIASIITSYSFKGILVSLMYVFPHHIINILIINILLIYAMALSSKLSTSVIKKKSIDFKPIINKYLFILLITSGVMVLTSLWEVFITPILIKLIIPIL
ncbi:MAG: stage II sporulation protein M [Bacilli bacterium]|nr:stage II sporulation protein M [Bacilli bacterium]